MAKEKRIRVGMISTGLSPFPHIFYKDQHGRTYCWTEPSNFPEEAPNRIEKKDGRILKRLVIDKTIHCYDEEG